MADSRAHDVDATPMSFGTCTRYDGNPRSLRSVRVSGGSLRASTNAHKGVRDCLVREGTKVSSEHGTHINTNTPAGSLLPRDLITQTDTLHAPLNAFTDAVDAHLLRAVCARFCAGSSSSTMQVRGSRADAMELRNIKSECSDATPLARSSASPPRFTSRVSNLAVFRRTAHTLPPWINHYSSSLCALLVHRVQSPGGLLM
jgi:hypothetical protein